MKQADSTNPIYHRLARFVYAEADKASVDNVESVFVVMRISRALAPLYNEIAEEVDGVDLGFMHEIDIWMGLKLDAPDMAKDYGKIIKQSYPEIFEDRLKVD